MHIEIRQITTLEIDGTFFDDRILMVRPESAYLKDCDMKKLCYNIFVFCREKFRSSEDAESVNTVTTKDHVNDIQDVFMDEFLSVCDQDITQPTAEEKLRNIFTYTFPSNLNYNSAPDVIGSERVSMHITRVLLQTVFEQLHSGKTTHMDVVNPLAIESHKWDEITAREDPKEKVNYHITNGAGLVFEGNCTTTPVILPAPEDNDILSHDEAAQAAKDIFNEMIDTYNLTLSSATHKYTRPDAKPFEPIETEGFVDELRATVKREVIKQCTPTEPQETYVTDCINQLLHPRTQDENYPDAIYCKNAIMHITRMVIQSLYDSLREHQTHMAVDDPLNISEHKWDEIPIQ